jgi:hypothetical protein
LQWVSETPIVSPMVKHTKRTAAETRLWDELVKVLAPKCIEFNATEGSAHLIREIADAIINERRDSIESDK